MTPQIVIPARFGSRRFPGKPLHMIGKRPLIEWTWRAAKSVGWPVLIATDDQEIAAIARDFGAEVEMTGPCRNGTERCAAAVRQRDIQSDIIINWQGDSPLCPPLWAEQLAGRLREDPAADVATPAMACEKRMERRLRADLASGIAGATTVAIGSRGQALYFSKAILRPAHFHVGLYAYRAEALAAYAGEPCLPELAEGLEQLRFLDMGARVSVVLVPARDVWEVNNPRDVDIVRAMIRDA